MASLVLCCGTLLIYWAYTFSIRQERQMKETRDAGDAASDLAEIHLSDRSDAHLRGKSVEKGDSSYLGVNLLCLRCPQVREDKMK